MIRYGIERNSRFMIKTYNKFLSLIMTTAIVPNTTMIDTGVHIQVDEGTLLMVHNNYGDALDYIWSRGEILLSTKEWPQSGLAPGTEVAKLIPLASAYFGKIEIERIRPEWFNMPSMLT